jgi:hypothetical protein
VELPRLGRCSCLQCRRSRFRWPIIKAANVKAD